MIIFKILKDHIAKGHWKFFCYIEYVSTLQFKFLMAINNNVTN